MSSANTTHLVDRLNQKALFDLALSQNEAAPRRAFAVPQPADLARLFPDLEILELVGTGGMGCVFKARQLRLDRFVALKILPKELARDELFAERFAREARAMARLNHPNVVRIYDYGKCEEVCFLLTEFMDGMNLRELMDVGKLAPEEAFRIFEQVCTALDFAHREGVTHRDIKPENILFGKSGNIALADFGLARLAMDSGCEVSLTQTRQAMGTLNYMAPEQWENPKAADHRADIYSMGILLYELLTGRVPRGSFPPASSLTAVSADVDHVIHKALQVDPEKRFPSAGAMFAELVKAASGKDSVSFSDQGTFTRFRTIGEQFTRKVAVPTVNEGLGAIGTIVSTIRNWDSSYWRPVWISSAICVLMWISMLCPWLNRGGYHQQGIGSWVLMGSTQVPVAVIAFISALMPILISARCFLGRIRADFFTLAICIVALVITGFALDGYIIVGYDNVTGDSLVMFDMRTSSIHMGMYRSTLTIIPYLTYALLAIQTFELVIGLLSYLVTCASDYQRRLDEERKRLWQRRWIRLRKTLFGDSRSNDKDLMG